MWYYYELNIKLIVLREVIPSLFFRFFGERREKMNRSSNNRKQYKNRFDGSGYISHFNNRKGYFAILELF